MERGADFELAAALVSLIGENIPHDAGKDAAASVLRHTFSDDRQALLRAVELCGRPETPAQFYLCTKIYSLLGRQYDALTAQYAEAYLSSCGWDALPSGETMERGRKIDLSARSRAGILVDLGNAYSGMENGKKACASYLRAYETVPCRIEYAVEAANAMVHFGKAQEAMNFLLLQKRSPCCKTVKYRSSTGRICYDSSYRDILELQIAALKKRLENRG